MTAGRLMEAIPMVFKLTVDIIVSLKNFYFNYQHDWIRY